MGNLRDVPGTEAYIKHHSVLRARAMGYTVVSTSSRKKNNNPGVPDVFVCDRGNHWIAIDFKTPKGKLSDEQKYLVENKHLAIATSPDEFIQLIVGLP